ncbi:MAG: AraC family transcriptional regulator [Gammaproteobacteria bacterium]|nr:AraC family transcriptional regulator [Gammaproteobacteria bacterium]
MALTHFAPATNMLWEHLEENGCDPAQLFIKAGISPELRGNPRARISLDALTSLWGHAVEALGDPCFGIKMAHYWHPSFMGALGYAWLVSTSLRTAFGRAERFVHVVSEGLDLCLSDTGRGLKVTVKIPDEAMSYPQQYQVTMAVLMRISRINFGDELKAVEITFQHAMPDCHEVFSSYFQSPLVYEASEYSMTFATGDIDRKLPTANKELALMHDEILMKYLVRIKKGDLVQQIQSLMIDQLPSGKVTDQMIARELHLSERTLQRKLRDKGTSFRQVLESVRKMVAMQYIRDTGTSMTEIAFLLGFSEQSAFSRAFKKWTGKSPVQYRESIDR